MKLSNEYNTQYDFNQLIANDDYFFESLINEVSKQGRQLHYIKEILLWLRAFLIVIVIVVIFRGFIGEPVIVKGPSMQNTLMSGDNLVMSKITYRTRGVKHGDIVVVEIEPMHFKHLGFLNDIVWFRRLFPSSNREDYIKRVIALEGDSVIILDGYVYINGQKLDEPYVKQQGTTHPKQQSSTYTVPKDHVYILGDNRTVSLDSRTMGAVHKDSIIGVIVYRLWPLNKFGFIPK